MNIKSHIDTAERYIRPAKERRAKFDEVSAFALMSIAESLLGIAKLLNEIEGNGYLRVRDEGGAI